MKWTETDDRAKFNDLSIVCNMNSWQAMKELYPANEKEDAFYIETEAFNNEGAASLNIEQAKELVKYLMQKIEYVEGLTYESFNDL